MLPGTFPPGCSQIHILLGFSRESAPCHRLGLNPGTMFTDMDRIEHSACWHNKSAVRPLRQGYRYDVATVQAATAVGVYWNKTRHSYYHGLNN